MIYDIMEMEWEIFHKLFQKATKEEWEELQCIPYALIQEEVQKYGHTISKFRHVWIDEEFFQWSQKVTTLSEKSNLALIEQYMEGLSDEEVIRLSHKHENNRELSFFLYPIALYTTQKSIAREVTVHGKILKELKLSLSRHFSIKKENILMHDRFIRMDDYFEFYYDSFEEKAIQRFFNPNQTISTPKIVDRPNGPSHAAIRILPIVINTEKQTIVTWEETFKTFPEEKMMSQKNMKVVFEELKKQFKNKFHFDMYRFVLEDEECETFAYDFNSFATHHNIFNRFHQKQGKLLRKNKNFAVL